MGSRLRGSTQLVWSKMATRWRALRWAASPSCGWFCSPSLHVGSARCRQRIGADDQPGEQAGMDRRERFDVDRGREGLPCVAGAPGRSEEHTSELQSLMRISHAVLCLKKK